MTRLERADRVFDILVEECGAVEDMREDFRFHFADTPEFRFQGHLGFGGKIHNPVVDPYVSCYPEDETSHRRAMINRANKRLDQMQNEAAR